MRILTTLSTVATLALALPAATALAQDTTAPPPATAGASGYRPTPLGVGVGLGYLVNTDIDLMKPSVASVRLVLTEQIVLEPIVQLSYASGSTETGMVTADTSATTVAFGTQLRYTVASRGPLDLAGIGQGLFSHGSTTSAGDIKNSAQLFSLRWGLGLVWWFYSTWSLSLDATNTFLNYTRSNVDNPGAAPDSTQSNLLFGVIWNPQVMVLAHMHF